MNSTGRPEREINTDARTAKKCATQKRRNYNYKRRALQRQLTLTRCFKSLDQLRVPHSGYVDAADGEQLVAQLQLQLLRLAALGHFYYVPPFYSKAQGARVEDN